MMFRRFATVTIALVVAGSAFAGSLTPPSGPVAPTMKTLTEVEPRTPVQSLPGSASALHVISQPGSYYLTGNIQGVAGKHGILITSPNVSLDLNGFTLVGRSDALDAIRAENMPSGQNIAVRNGYVYFWRGGRGVNLAAGSDEVLKVVQNIHVFDVGTDGIVTGGESIVTDCTVAGAGGNGFIIGVVPYGAGNPHSASIVERCIARNNLGSGFLLIGTRIHDCTTRLNRGDGIRLRGYCFASNNLCDQNGYFGSGAGISMVDAGGNRVESNQVSFGDWGIRADVGGNLVISNSASANGTNYAFVAGNNYGQIIVSPGAGFAMTNPAANLEF